MSSAVTASTLHYLFRVNCYVVETDGGYVLIDAGLSPHRAGRLGRAVQPPTVPVGSSASVGG